MNEVEGLTQAQPSQTSNYAARKRRSQWFARITFAPVIIALAVLLILTLDVVSDTWSWQVVTPAGSGQTFAFSQGLNTSALIRRELEARGQSAEEIAAFFADSEEMRKFKLRNRIQLMWQTDQGAFRWAVVGLRDELEENYTVFQGFRNFAQIKAELGEGQRLYLNPWLDASYFQYNASRSPMMSGLRGAILGSLWVIFFVTLFVIPVGTGAAIYLEEYALKSRFSRFLEINIRNLAGVPSIVYGVLGLYLFVRFMKLGPTVLAAALTLGLLVLPIVVIAAREAIRAVPDSLRQASYGLGASKWQTVSKVVLPSAAPGIATGVLLAIARAIGETAPLLLVGAAAFVPFDPTGPLSEYTVVPVQIYSWISENDPEFKNVAAAAIVILLVFMFFFNMLILQVRRRFSKR